MSDPALSPQNPYRSFCVKASAGTGKTYQLSKRFLNLVAAGTDPTLILTVTFTKKAAQEMRERILRDCHAIIASPELQADFDTAMQAFHQLNPDLAPPITATEAATWVISSQQNLSIETMDSFFHTWTQQFPFEAAQNPLFPTRFELLASHEKSALLQKAWDQTLAQLDHDLMASLAQVFPQKGLLDFDQRLESLFPHELFLWQKSYEGLASTQTFPLVEYGKPEQDQVEILQFLRSTQEFFSKSGQEKAALFLKSGADTCQGDDFLQQLVQHKIVSGAKMSLYKTLLPKKAQEEHAAAVDHANTCIRSLWNRARIQELNAKSQLLSLLFENYRQQFENLKFQASKVEFADLMKASYHLFQSPEAAGAKYLIQRGIHHLLLDEFQDTNDLQWSIFEAITRELLAGENHDLKDRTGPSTLFVVGDKKQSIYGFREANPELFERIEATFPVTSVELRHSYRTCQTLLDVANRCFQTPDHSCHLPNFPLHETARQGETPHVPNEGSFLMSPFFTPEDDETAASPVEQEAAFVAAYCQHVLNDPSFRTWDNGAFRTLKPSDIAILYRQSTHAQVYEEALFTEGLAASQEGQDTLPPEVQDLMALYKLLCLPADLEALCAVLKSPYIGIASDTLMTWLQDSLDLPVEERVQELFTQVLNLQPQLKVLQDAVLKTQPSEHAPKERFCQLIRELAVVSAYQKAWPEHAAETQACIEEFVEVVRNLPKAGTLSNLQHLQELMKEGHAYPKPADQDCIQLMTVHKSKGLEFPVVIIVDTGQAWWKKDRYWVKAEQELYYIGTKKEAPIEDPYVTRIQNTLEQQLKEEANRLLYVALTRSSQHIMVSGYARSAKTEKAESESFYHAIDNTLDAASTYTFGDYTTKCIQQRVDQSTTPAVADKKVVNLPKLNSKTASVVPTEVRNITPHSVYKGQTRLQVQSEQTSVPAVWKQAVGLWVHKGLECHVRQEDFPAEFFWQSYTQSITEGSDDTAAYHYAQKQLADCLQSAAWQNLVAGAEQLQAEVPLVYQKDSAFVHGSVDLVIRRADNIHIVDYKSQAVSAQSLEGLTPKEQQDFCREQGYTAQVQAYVEGCQILYPNHRIYGGVFFTAPQTYIGLL